MRISKTILLSAASILFFLPGTASATGAPDGFLAVAFLFVLAYILFFVIIKSIFAIIIIPYKSVYDLIRAISVSTTISAIIALPTFIVIGTNFGFNHGILSTLMFDLMIIPPIFYITVIIEYRLLNNRRKGIKSELLKKKIVTVNLIFYICMALISLYNT